MGAIVPFRKSSGGGPRVRASGRVECVLHPAADQWETLRKARAHVAEAWRLKLESAAVKRGYEERQRKIDELLARIRDEVERA